MKTIYRLFAGSNTHNAVAIMFLAVLLWLPAFFKEDIISQCLPVEPMPFFKWLSYLTVGNSNISVLLAFILVVSGAVLINYFNTRYILVNRRSFLPSYFFMLTVSLFPDLQSLNPLLPSMLFLILAVYLLFSTYKAEEDSLRFFEIGMLLGTGSLFFAPLLWFVIFIWIATCIMRPFRWREWIYPVAGIIVPYILLWTYYYVFSDDGGKLFTLLADNLIPVYELPETGRLKLVKYIYILILVIISSIYMVRVFQFRKVYIRIYYHVFLWLFILGFLILAYTHANFNGILYFVMIPASYLITNYFIESKLSFVNQILFLSGLVLAIAAKIIEFSGIL